MTAPKPDWAQALEDESTFAAWLGEGDAPARPTPTADERARAKARSLALVYQRIRMRGVATFVKAWDSCDKPACRRARACRSETVVCFTLHREEIRDRLQQLVDWEVFDGGGFGDDDLDRLARDLRKLGAPL
jgi:hypothetical protein